MATLSHATQNTPLDPARTYLGRTRTGKKVHRLHSPSDRAEKYLWQAHAQCNSRGPLRWAWVGVADATHKVTCESCMTDWPY